MPSFKVGGSIGSLPLVEAFGYITPQMFGAKMDGVTDDTAALNACFAAAQTLPKVGGVFLGPPKGTYAVTGTVDMTGGAGASAVGINVIGGNLQNGVRIKPLNDIAGPVLSANFSTVAAAMTMYLFGIYVDMTLSPSASGIYVNNIQLLDMDRCKTREGNIGLEIGAVSAGNFWRLVAYNAITAHYQYDAGTTTNNQGHTWIGCNAFVSSGVTHDCGAGWLDLSGHQDQTYYGCRAQRIAGTNFKFSYGFKFDGSGAAAAGQTWMLHCNADAITDGLNPGNAAAYYFNKITNVRMGHCWASALDTGKVWREPAVIVDQCTRVDISECYLSGTGLKFGTSGASDMVHLRGNHFPNPNTADACIQMNGATVTNMLVQGNTKEKDAAPWFDNATQAQAAMAKVGNVY